MGKNIGFVSTRFAGPWGNNGNGQAKYSLWDVYPFADFITYPSFYEGFGNAFLEAVYFRKPMLINRYATFVRDIEPQGFDLAVMDGFISRKTVRNVIEILESTERREKMVNYNYEVAARHYSYSVLRTRLNAIMNYFFGNSVKQLSGKSSFPENEDYLNIEPPKTLHKHFDGRNSRISST